MEDTRCHSTPLQTSRTQPLSRGGRRPHRVYLSLAVHVSSCSTRQSAACRSPRTNHSAPVTHIAAATRFAIATQPRHAPDPTALRKPPRQAVRSHPTLRRRSTKLIFPCHTTTTPKTKDFCHRQARERRRSRLGPTDTIRQGALWTLPRRPRHASRDAHLGKR